MTSTTTNNALFVDGKSVFGVSPARTAPEPNDGEILVEVQYSGANPADINHVTLLGVNSTVLGYDFCGKVLKAPFSSTFSPGNLIAGYTPTGIDRPSKYGSHQQYLICPEDMAFSVPANLPPQHAACLSVVFMTAADALYNIFKLPLPQETPKNHSTGPLLIWGASSSVGICAVQLARASGVYPIFVTASPERHPLLLEMGATRCFDYKAPDVATVIGRALTDAHCDALHYGFDAVGSQGSMSSALLLAQCTSKNAKLASVTIQNDHRFKLPFATPNRDVTFKMAGDPHPITIPARPDDYQRVRKALQWVIANYSGSFLFPSVEVFEGTAQCALEELKSLADGGRGFGKLVLKHPLR
ncbi:chaperonin 10-like protein [Penicillium frequentans]|nr:chaperonin 10-like protein [Penicillium glabrum]